MKRFAYLWSFALLWSCGVPPSGKDNHRNPLPGHIDDDDGKGSDKDDDTNDDDEDKDKDKGQSPEVKAGSALYAQHCASCHGDLASSTKRNQSAGAISAAIAAIPNMKFLSTLSSGDVAKIAAALANDDNGGNPPPPPTDLSGAELYAAHCASCHGALATSTKRDRSANDISSAIEANANMNFLSTLSADDIAAIAAVLDDEDGGGGGPPPAQDGAELYAAHCAACHGPIATSTKKGSTSTQIGSAVQNVPEMNSAALQELSPLQIGLISLALANQSTDDSTIEGSLGTRSLFATKLGTIFGSGGTIDTILRNNVTQQAPVFGGSCQKFDDGGCQSDDTSTADVEMSGRSTALRSGYHRKSCLEILSIAGTTETALARMGLTVQSPIDAANLNKMADLFFAGRALDANAVAKLLALAAAGGAANGDAGDKWSLVLLAFCQSSAFELL